MRLREAHRVKRRYVYFARSDLRPGLVKIGQTSDPVGRMQALEAEALLLLEVPAGYVDLYRNELAVERLFHKRYAHLRVWPRREWFRAEGELARFA